MTAPARTIGIDIGGTKIAAGVVTAEGEIEHLTRRPSPADDPDALDDAIAECVAELREKSDVGAVGLAAAGYVSEDRSTMSYAPNLAWRDRPLAPPLRARTGLDVVVENDANAAAWAEYRFGAGRGCQDAVLVTLGTGVGGGIVVGGRLVRGGHGYAAELGHLRAVPRGLPCGCGQLGCWEQYISGNALVAEARRRAGGDPVRWRGVLGPVGGDEERIDGPLLTELAAAGEPVAVDLVHDLATMVGEFCSSVVAVLDPEVIVLGGGLGSVELLLEPARAAFTRTVSPRGHHPPVEIRVAEMGNTAGIVGAADLARILS
ncbi:MAG: ROK family glucokinase [Kineosporiaceae bacterium]